MEKVKTAKLQLMRRDFEVICMKESDTIDSFFTMLIRLVTQMRSHGEIVEERRIMDELLKSLPSRFDVIVTTIEEKKYLSKFTVDELHASLMTDEKILRGTTDSSLEHAFKTQISFGRGRSKGRGNYKGKGRGRRQNIGRKNRGGRNNPSHTHGRSSDKNQNQGQYECRKK